MVREKNEGTNDLGMKLAIAVKTKVPWQQKMLEKIN
jgi:hypothetical protein